MQGYYTRWEGDAPRKTLIIVIRNPFSTVWF